MNVVKFAYYDEFRCIGPECMDSCCKDWHINLSKREYLDYKKMKCSPQLRSVADNAFRRKKNGNDMSYAEMKLKENGDCPFLGKDSLCMIQKEKGEEALTFVCSIFPRINMLYQDQAIILGCHATCQRVIEILMSHPEGLEIVETEYDGKNKYINSGKYTQFSITKENKVYNYYWNILNAQIDILQNRNFTVPERMLILGYFCSKADGYAENNEAEKIPALADMLLDNELCRKIADSLKPSLSDINSAIQSVNILTKMNTRTQIFDSLKATSKKFDKVMERLKFEKQTAENGEASLNFDVSEYEKLCKIYRSIENERPYIIENLLVNTVFTQNPQKRIWKNYFTLAVFYNVLKICAPVFLPENFNDRELAVALTYAAKMVLNSHLAGEGTFTDFFMADKHTLPYAAFLIC